MTGWWRRNRIALLLLLGLIPVAVVPLLYVGTRQAGMPLFSDDPSVDAGSSIMIRDSTVKVRSVIRVAESAADADQVGLRPGTNLVVVRVEVAKHGAGGWCSARLRLPNGTRSSPAGPGRVGYAPKSVNTWCSFDETFDLSFLLPAGAPDPVALSVTTIDEARQTWDFRLPPVKQLR